MPTFKVTTALTVYTTYTVEADHDWEAKEMVVTGNRAVMDYVEDGDNSDETVIAVRQVGSTNQEVNQ